jgi:dihydrofolate reductase
MIYGHGRLSKTLLEHHLVDEVRFSVHPVLVGGPATNSSTGRTIPLTFLGATPSPSGVVALTYQLPPTER